MAERIERMTLKELRNTLKALRIDFNTRDPKKPSEDEVIITQQNQVDIKRSFLKHPLVSLQGLLDKLILFRLISLCLLILSSGTALFVILERHGIPTYESLTTLGLIFSSYYVGETFQKLFHLPNVIGMYLTGILFRHFVFVGSIDHLRPAFITARYIAISVVLVRSGLGLNLEECKKYPIDVLVLSTIPMLSEVFAIVLSAKYLLPYEYSWLWTFLCGFSVSPLSPTLAVQILGRNKSKRYFNEKLSSVYMNCAPLEDIACIALFGVVICTIAQKDGSTENRLIYSFLQLLLGFCVGVIWGLLSSFFPNKKDDNCVLKKSIMIFLGGICIYLGSKSVGLPASGPFGCFVCGTAASVGFKAQGWDQANPVSKVSSKLWSYIMEPLLFALVGIEFDFSTTSTYDVAMSTTVITIGTMTRSIFCIISLQITDFTIKEKTFFTLANFPKATVQAALGPQSFDLFWNTKDREKSLNILKTSVLAVLVVTTISSIILKLFGNKLLKNGHPRQKRQENYI